MLDIDLIFLECNLFTSYCCISFFMCCAVNERQEGITEKSRREAMAVVMVMNETGESPRSKNVLNKEMP